MNNVLKNTLIYTGLYFLFCTVFMLFAVVAQIFWKPIAAFFVIVFAWLSIDFLVNKTVRETIIPFAINPNNMSTEEKLSALKAAMASNSKL